jgi:hypothetical protein
VSYARRNAYASAKHEVVRKAPTLPDRSRVLVQPLDVLQTGVTGSVASQGSVEMSWHLRRMVVTESVLSGGNFRKCRWAVGRICRSQGVHGCRAHKSL